jgi:HK97 family phage prohead protease
MNYALDMEIRDVTVSRREIVGRCAPYGETSYLTGDARGERLLPGCFATSIRQRGDRIPLCLGHQHGRAAVGLSLRDGWQDSPDGLVGVWRVRPDAEGDKVLADVHDGYLPQMSVGFAPVHNRTRRGVDGALEVTEAVLKEVSLVSVGAYDGAVTLATRAAVEVPDLAAILAPFGNRPEVNLDPLPRFGI